MTRSDPRSLATGIPRALKRDSGATRVAKTPIEVRATGVALDPALRKRIPAALGRKIERYALNVTRVAVRFRDINGPRGGVDTVCRIKLSMSGRDHVVVEAREADADDAFRAASQAAGTALRRAFEREQPDRAQRLVGRAGNRPRAARKAPTRRPRGGSLIGRRVGRSKENLLEAAARPEKKRRDVWTDTSLPGVSETDRKAGGGSTAARNTKLRAPRATATLEDSAKQRPSRKSTRKSANRQKSASKLHRRQKRALHAPSARAARSQ